MAQTTFTHKQAEATLQDIPQVVADVEFALQEQGLDISSYTIDHICWRCASTEEYTNMKALFSTLAHNLKEGMVNGRLISTFKLHTPITVGDQMIDIVELPDVKDGSPYESGWEHVEYTVPCLSEFQAQNTHIGFDTSALKGHHPCLQIQATPQHNVKLNDLSLEDKIAQELEAQQASK